MIYSMTGFGKSSVSLLTKNITIEIRTLNSKQLDVNFRLPGIYKEKEIELRNITTQKLVRGKVDVSIFIDGNDFEEATHINKEVVHHYYKELKDISGELGISDSENLLTLILKLPDVLKTERQKLDDEEWKVLSGAFEAALADTISFRRREGAAIQNDMVQSTKEISSLLDKVIQLGEGRITEKRKKLIASLNELSKEITYDKNRFEQELVYYLEKLDINEEKVRLTNHCRYFLETLEADHTQCKELQPAGKKLGFITQEMGREINTIGSKANHSGMQHLVVRMKEELEKIKEQILNVL